MYCTRPGISLSGRRCPQRREGSTYPAHLTTIASGVVDGLRVPGTLMVGSSASTQSYPLAETTSVKLALPSGMAEVGEG